MMIPKHSVPTALHESAIDSLVQETTLPKEAIVELYDAELATLEPQATITQFLPLIVSRRVKQWLRQHSRLH
jgi:hypothetical protein